MESKFKEIGNVTFPDFTGERMYMIPFKKGDAIGRWSKTVEDMISGVHFEGEAYLTVDQSHVRVGLSQRREGLHIDGNWIKEQKSWSYWDTQMWSNPPTWRTSDQLTGGIIVASDCVPTTIYTGTFSGVIGDGGDCSSLDISGCTQHKTENNVAYLGNVCMLHEATKSDVDCDRTFVRIILPADFKYVA